MQIIPAIDLRGGQVVRLLRGEYDQETVYQHSPSEVAKLWQDGGAKLIHIVDLDGAREGVMQNSDAIREITEAVEIKTELGGGLRDMESIEFVLNNLGVDRAILGSVLLENPHLVYVAARHFPHRIILGIDARDGMVATCGWRNTSSVNALELVNEFDMLDIGGIIYTDISRDGTMEGPNLDAIKEMAERSPFPLIASGGIGDLSHIKALAELNKTIGGDRITGVIVGKALYENQFTLEEAIKVAQE